MSRQINVTVSMPVAMLDRIEEQVPDDMSRAEFIRRCIRDDYEEQFSTDADASSEVPA